MSPPWLNPTIWLHDLPPTSKFSQRISHSRADGIIMNSWSLTSSGFSFLWPEEWSCQTFSPFLQPLFLHSADHLFTRTVEPLDKINFKFPLLSPQTCLHQQPFLSSFVSFPLLKDNSSTYILHLTPFSFLPGKLHYSIYFFQLDLGQLKYANLSHLKINSNLTFFLFP